MTTQAPTPWTELLSRRFRNVSDEYGPHSQAVASAFAVLDKMQWLQHVGEPVNSGTVVVVRSWDEALTIFGKDRRYNANGILEAPCERIDAVFERFPEREPWWQRAREDSRDGSRLHHPERAQTAVLTGNRDDCSSQFFGTYYKLYQEAHSRMATVMEGVIAGSTHEVVHKLIEWLGPMLIAAATLHR